MFTARTKLLLELIADMDANDWSTVPDLELTNIRHHVEYEMNKRALVALKAFRDAQDEAFGGKP